MSVVRQGDLVVTIGTGGRSPALRQRTSRRTSARRWGPSTARSSTCSSEAREAMRAAGRSSRGRRLAAGARFRHARSDPQRPGGRGEGAAPDVSLVVVGLNHRTAPVELLERMAVPARALPKALHALAAREHLAEVVLALHVQPHRGLRAHHAVPPRHRRRPPLPRRHAGPRPRRPRRAALHVPRRRRGRAPLRRCRRPRLDDHRRGRDPRPGRARRGASPSTRAPPARCCRARSARRSRSGKRARTETEIGRHAVSIVVGRGHAGGGAARFARGPPRARARCRRRGPEHGHRARRRGRRRDRGRQPHPEPWPRPRRAGRRARRRARRRPRRRSSTADVLLVVDRCRPRSSSSGATWSW